MDQVPEEKKDALTKTFAIVGFTALLIFVVWLAVQLVSIVPSAFSSLASLADSVYNYDAKQELEVATDNSVANAGESFTISWTALRGVGEYSFSFVCTEGVALEAKNTDGEVVSLACDTPLSLGKNTSLDVLVASEKHRFVDVPYTITFAREGTEEGMKQTLKTVTIVNASIPTGGVLSTDTKEPATVTPSVTPTTKPVVYKPATGANVVYTYPVSNPKGSIDLQVSYLGAGTLSQETFTKTITIDNDRNGAIKFEVKNNGTKTAEDWSYVAHLPFDITYTSPAQKALKPQERAIITLGFDGLSKNGTAKISVDVSAKNDVNDKNNKVTATVEIVD